MKFLSFFFFNVILNFFIVNWMIKNWGLVGSLVADVFLCFMRFFLEFGLFFFKKEFFFSVYIVFVVVFNLFFEFGEVIRRNCKYYFLFWVKLKDRNFVYKILFRFWYFLY